MDNVMCLIYYHHELPINYYPFQSHNSMVSNTFARLFAQLLQTPTIKKLQNWMRRMNTLNRNIKKRWRAQFTYNTQESLISLWWKCIYMCTVYTYTQFYERTNKEIEISEQQTLSYFCPNLLDDVFFHSRSTSSRGTAHLSNFIEELATSLWKV